MPLHHFTYGMFAHHTTSHNSLEYSAVAVYTYSRSMATFVPHSLRKIINKRNKRKKYGEGKICGEQIIMKRDILRIKCMNVIGKVAKCLSNSCFQKYSTFLFLFLLLRVLFSFTLVYLLLLFLLDKYILCLFARSKKNGKK